MTMTRTMTSGATRTTRCTFLPLTKILLTLILMETQGLAITCIPLPSWSNLLPTRPTIPESNTHSPRLPAGVTPPPLPSRSRLRLRPIDVFPAHAGVNLSPQERNRSRGECDNRGGVGATEDTHNHFVDVYSIEHEFRKNNAPTITAPSPRHHNTPTSATLLTCTQTNAKSGTTTPTHQHPNTSPTPRASHPPGKTPPRAAQPPHPPGKTHPDPHEGSICQGDVGHDTRDMHESCIYAPTNPLYARFLHILGRM